MESDQQQKEMWTTDRCENIINLKIMLNGRLQRENDVFYSSVYWQSLLYRGLCLLKLIMHIQTMSLLCTVLIYTSFC